MKPLLLFDVDGTIAESGKKIDNKIFELLKKLSVKYDLGVVGGGKYEKIIEQINNSKIFSHIFAECGCVYYKLKLLNYEPVYELNIRIHPLYNQINQLVKTALGFLSQVDYIISGNFIDLRKGIIYISLIGMSATNEEREYFIELDKKQNIRKKLLNKLTNKAFELNIQDQIKILEGGSVGIGIYPIEYGKIQVLKHLKHYNSIRYFGDKYLIDGNDYDLITSKLVRGYLVDSVDDTIDILEKLLDFWI